MAREGGLPPWWAQPRKRDLDESSNRGLRCVVASRTQGVHAIPCEFVRLNVASHVPVAGGSADQVSDQFVDPSLCPSEMLIPMQEGCQTGVCVSTRMSRQVRVRLQDGREPLVGTFRAIPDLDEMSEMGFDLAFMPRNEDRSDIGEVLVEGRSPYACFFRDTRHRHPEQTFFGDEHRRRVQDRVLHLATVGLDRLRP